MFWIMGAAGHPAYAALYRDYLETRAEAATRMTRVIVDVARDEGQDGKTRIGAAVKVLSAIEGGAYAEGVAAAPAGGPRTINIGAPWRERGERVVDAEYEEVE